MKIEIGRKSAEGWGLRSISWRFILANIESGAGLFMLVAGLNCTFVTLRCYARSVSTIGKTGQPTYIYVYICNHFHIYKYMWTEGQKRVFAPSAASTIRKLSERICHDSEHEYRWLIANRS